MGILFRYLNLLSGGHLRRRLAAGVNYNILRSLECLESDASDCYKVEYAKTRLSMALRSINDIFGM